MKIDVFGVRTPLYYNCTRDVTVGVWCDLYDVGAESAPSGWNKVSENLGATTVAPVAPAVTSLHTIKYMQQYNGKTDILFRWYRLNGKGVYMAYVQYKCS